jgi:hypothetical protein
MDRSSRVVIAMSRAMTGSIWTRTDSATPTRLNLPSARLVRWVHRS